MHKLLPKTAGNPRGFTLIELLVVISIIAILAVIGLAIFSGVTARGRNAKRRADVLAIVGAFEANKTPDSNRYSPLLGNQFSGGNFPEDPSGRVAGIPQYSIIYNNDLPGAVVNGIPLANWAGGAVNPTAAGTRPTGGTLVVVSVNNADPAALIPGSGAIIYSFAVCARLEPEVIGGSTPAPFCRNSSQ